MGIPIVSSLKEKMKRKFFIFLIDLMQKKDLSQKHLKYESTRYNSKGKSLPVDNEFKEYISLRIAEEKKANQLLQDTIGKTENTVIRLLLHQLALDSAKHELMLKTVLELLNAPPTSCSGGEDKSFRDTISQHVKIEEEMIRGFEKIVDDVKDKRVRFILQDIISDEKKHQAIVKRIYDLICENKKKDDDDWWDFIYRYSHLDN